MSRPSQISFSALNLTCHPHHGAKTYVKLFTGMFEMDLPIRLRGDECAILGTLTPTDASNPEAGLEGEIFRFTSIDPEAEWLDLKTRKALLPDSGKIRAAIDASIQPNLRRLRYIFFPEHHRMVFITRKGADVISPNQVADFIEILAQRYAAKEKIGVTSVTIEQSRETLGDILDRYNLRTLEITIKKPNGDDDDGEEEETLESVLVKQGAKRMAVSLTAERNQYLKPDKKNRKLAKLALSNGSVKATHETQDGKVEPVDTARHPLIKKKSYDSRGNFRDWFLTTAKDILDLIV